MNLPTAQYGDTCYNTSDRIFRIYDGNKWVTYYETTDMTLRMLLGPTLLADKIANNRVEPT